MSLKTWVIFKSFDILAELQSSPLRVIRNLKLTSLAQGKEGLVLIYPCLSLAFYASSTIRSDPTLLKVYIHIKSLIPLLKCLTLVLFMFSGGQYWKTLFLPLVHIPYKPPLGKYIPYSLFFTESFLCKPPK